MFTETIPMKGSVLGVTVIGNTVQVWVSSPTGDSTDSLIFNIPTTSHAHAITVGNMWRQVWGLVGTFVAAVEE
jgi:hypothetical protein